MSEIENKIVFGTLESRQLILQLALPLSKTVTGKSILMQVEGLAGEFRGFAVVHVSLDMLEHTLKALSEFSENPRGEFTLASESREFWASMTGDGTGKIFAHCTLNDFDNRYTRLRFEVEFAKKQVLEHIHNLKKITKSISEPESKRHDRNKWYDLSSD
jgi:hypothetical protein